MIVEQMKQNEIANKSKVSKYSRVFLGAGKLIWRLGHSIHHNNSILGYKDSSDKSNSDSKIDSS